MANPNSRKNNPQAKMALGEHFREFRNRLIKSAVATVLTSIAGFFLYEPFIDAISGPLAEINSIDGREAVLNFATPAASFNLMVSVSLYIGLVLASPVWLYQLWAFITPALYKKEKLYAIGFVAAAVPMFFIGLAVAWWCIPAAIKALTMFNPQGTTNIMGADIYIAFFIKFMVVFGVAFVLPVVLVGVNMMGLIRGRTLLKAWRWVIVLVATLAAAVAPGTDPMTMFYLAAPLIIFFFIAIGICMMNDKRRDKKNAKLAAGLTDDELNRATSAEELDQLGRVEQN